MGKYGYMDIKSRLNSGVLFIVFTKKNGESRKMLCTRNSSVIEMCIGSPIQIGNSRCTLETGSISVFDMIINQQRAVTVENIEYVEDYGVISTAEMLNCCYMVFERSKTEWDLRNKTADKTKDTLMSFDSLVAENTR